MKGIKGIKGIMMFGVIVVVLCAGLFIGRDILMDPEVVKEKIAESSAPPDYNVSFEEVKEKFINPISFPDELPKGMTKREVFKLDKETDVFSFVDIFYSTDDSGESYLDIILEKSPYDEFEKEDGDEEISVNGTKIVYNEKDGVLKAYLVKKETSFRVKSEGISKEDVFEFLGEF